MVSGIYTFTLEDMTSLAALQMQHVFGEYDECRVNELVYVILIFSIIKNLNVLS